MSDVNVLFGGCQRGLTGNGCSIAAFCGPTDFFTEDFLMVNRFMFLTLSTAFIITGVCEVVF